MAYHFRRNQSVPDNIRRIAREEFNEAALHLRGRKPESNSEAVHEARKNLKKLRALLRLVKSELGSAYKLEARALRDMGRRLSTLRDADALFTALDQLKSKLPAKTMSAIRRGLEKHKKQVESEAAFETLMPQLATDLGKARLAVKDWPMKADGFDAIASGLEEAYRAGRAAFRRAHKHSDRERWHEWRKRVKDYWYHVRLLENIWSEVMQGEEASLKNLQDTLGDDLTLDLLREHLLLTPKAYGTPAEVKRVVGAIEELRKAMRKQAVEAGKRIYGQKPGALMTELRRLWEAW